MPTEYFTVKHDVSKTVYLRFLRLSDNKVFDFDDDTWETNLAACTDPKLSAAENTDMGDATYSIYKASYDLDNMNSAANPIEVLVQAMDDLAADEIIAETTFWIAAGRVLDQDWLNRRIQALALENTYMQFHVASVADATRKVAVGKLDYISFKSKLDADADWSVVVTSGDVRAWYVTSGDSDPEYMKEDG